jgi:hypothetical protein
MTATAGITGTFATASLPTLGGNLSWDLDYSATSLTLSVVTDGPSADFDNDGDVDANDLAKWKVGFGKQQGAEPFDGDADGDFDVDGGDFLVWQRQFGSAAPTSPAAGVVPEPTTVTLAAVAALSLAWARSRRRQH